mmetsp:Transcript_9991/g.42480  ORF Transcript_9991/g.42480 Transcript_9991/m.42480 type:complete len:230 (+) Transcript_9991:258-947(+)
MPRRSRRRRAPRSRRPSRRPRGRAREARPGASTSQEPTACTRRSRERVGAATFLSSTKPPPSAVPNRRAFRRSARTRRAQRRTPALRALQERCRPAVSTGACRWTAGTSATPRGCVAGDAGSTGEKESATTTRRRRQTRRHLSRSRSIATIQTRTPETAAFRLLAARADREQAGWTSRASRASSARASTQRAAGRWTSGRRRRRTTPLTGTSDAEERCALASRFWPTRF